MKGNQHEEVRSLLDWQIKAAAGAVVGAKDQHHILVADGAAQRSEEHTSELQSR